MRSEDGQSLAAAPAPGRQTPGPSTPCPPSAASAGWDEAARPFRAQSSDQEEASELGQAVGQHLIDVHDHLRGELQRLRGLVEQLREGEINGGQARAAVNQMVMRQNDWTVGAYCASYCSIVTQHHGMEDAAIFPHLRGREPDLAPVLDQLAAEHKIIHLMLERLDRAFVAYIAQPRDFTDLDAALEALDHTLLSHLGYEEDQLVEPLARHGFYPGQVS